MPQENMQSDLCMYCGERKKFTAEHVVSAGLGGDDPDWMLTDCVCGDCNTKIFSPLELKAFRSSPLALSRIFLQPSTRGRTGKASAPTIQPRASYYQEPQSGILLEQVMQAGGKPVVLPQILILPDSQVICSLPDEAAGQKFLNDLKSALGDEVSLVEKVREGSEARFYRLPLRWAGEKEGYQPAGEREGMSRAPREVGIWFEEPIWPSTEKEGDFAQLPPRIFQREGGQLVCRVSETKKAFALLSLMRLQLEEIVIPKNAQVTTDARPRVRQSFQMDMSAYGRTLVKIGLNLCAKLIEPNFVRAPAFDRARRFVLTGEGSSMPVSQDNIERIRGIFGPTLQNHHVFMLAAGEGRTPDEQALAYFYKLYGGGVGGFCLAELPRSLIEFAEPKLVVVDYIKNTILAMSLEEYAAFVVKHTA